MSKQTMQDVLNNLDLTSDNRVEAFNISTKGIYNYKFGTVEGNLILGKRSLELLFIGNNMPHNGDFQRFIEYLEDGAEDVGYKLYVKHLINKRLVDWFVRRGWKHKHQFDRVSYQHKGVSS